MPSNCSLWRGLRPGAGRSQLPLLGALFLLVAPAWAVDADLEALHVVTGAEDQAALDRARDWTESAKDDASAAAYLQVVRNEAFDKPRELDVVRHYIQVATSQQKTEELLAELRSYAESNPDRSEAHYYLGLAQPEEGARHFRRALELDPKSYYALVGMASAELSTDPPDLGSAKSRLFEAARLAPSEPLAFVVLEQLYRRTGDVDSQVLSMAKAVEADPWDERLQQGLLRQLQAQAQAVQTEGGDVSGWVEHSTGLLSRLARVGPGQSQLALAAARIWGSTGNTPKALDGLRLAADLGYTDPRGLAFDRTLVQAVSNNPAAAPILARMETNREEHAEELKAQALRALITLPTPEVATIPLMGGGTLDLESKKGKVVILDFWATWCGPCRRALPVVQQLYEKKLKDVEIYCVNVFERDGGKQVEGFWKSGGYPMPVALGTQDWATSFGVASIPTLFLIGPDGKIRYRHQGFSPYLDQELAWIAEGLLAND